MELTMMLNPRSKRPLRSLLLWAASSVCLMLITSVPASATDDHPAEAAGYQETGYALSNYETINLANGNLTFKVPIHTLFTDGGLSYEIALYHNLKRWTHARWCHGTQEQCEGSEGIWYAAEVADGVENYGFTWDLRPERITLFESNPGQSNSPPHILTSSGEKHYLLGTPPWEEQGLFPAECRFSNIDPDPNSVCFTDTNIRVTALGFDNHEPTGFIAESPDGTVRIYSHRVDAVSLPLPPPHEQHFLFGRDGYYLTSIERGPWDANGAPANQITFEYCSDPMPNPDSPNHTCGVTDPWLIGRVSATGGQPFGPVRSVLFEYSSPGGVDFDVLTKVYVPGFDPILELEEGEVRDPIWNSIQLEYQEKDFTAHSHIGTDGQPVDLPVTVPYLTTVIYPDGGSFAFRSNSEAVVDWLKLPSGAQVEYEICAQSWPIGIRNCVHHSHPVFPEGDGGEALDQCTYPQAIGCTCSGSSPPEGPDLPSSSDYWTEGVMQRTIRYHDAANTADDDLRSETTSFTPYRSCVEACGGQLPYDFAYGLQYHEGHLELYLWTVVETYSSDEPEVKAVEIHRFNPFNYHEFSADYLDLVPSTTVVGPGEDGGEYFENWEGARRLRHVEFEYQEKNDIGDSPMNGGFQELHRYGFNGRTSTFTIRDEDDEGGFCYGGDPGCTVVTELVENDDGWIDQYLNIKRKRLTATNMPGVTDVIRESKYTYAPFELSDPSVDPWRGMSLVETERVCYGNNCSESTSTSWNTPRAYQWQEVTNSAGPGGFYRLEREFVNPDVLDLSGEQDHSCSADCVSHDYSYDLWGNRTSDTAAGGYGAGFGSSYTVGTQYLHGQPRFKFLELSTGTLTLWRREIDENTGLARWHVDGSGSGYAYLYNAMGRVTEIAPVDMSFVSGVYQLRHQCAEYSPVSGFCTTWMLETHVDYTYPELYFDDENQPVVSGQLEHTLYDSIYDGVPANGVIGNQLEPGSFDSMPERRSLVFDGLGRLTQTVERMPTTNPDNPPPATWRSQFNLDYYDANGHVQQSSEWYSENVWPTSGAGLHWTITSLDGLGRPLKITKPDLSEERFDYIGDSTTTVNTSIGDVFNEVTGTVDEGTYRVTRLVDGLGRLRRLSEEVRTDVFLNTEYSYDEMDRLVSVQVGGQTRSFTYTNGGYLASSVEPERSTNYHSYDARGNLLSEKTGVPTTTWQYDQFGRLAAKTNDSDGSSSTYYYGDTYSGAAPWTPDYNKIVKSDQVNIYPDTTETVTVSNEWWYDGPGSRVSTRATSISGLGDQDDHFSLEYAYDRWGNLSQTRHPAWSWADPCSPTVSEERVFDGSWLVRSDILVGGEPEGGVDVLYHENGRPSEVKFFSGRGPFDLMGWETEGEDPDGMARPSNYDLEWDSESVWFQGDYQYDGSGNITGIGGPIPKNFTYDGLNRLTHYYEAGALAQSYPYDNYGNLLALGDLSFSITSNRITAITFGGSYPVTWNGRGNLTIMPAILNAGLKEKRYFYSGEDRLMRSAHVDGSINHKWRYAYDSAGERVAAWQRDTEGDLVDVTLFLRDEGGRVLSDWLLFPGVSFGPKRDYLYAGDRLALQLDWSEGESPVRQYIAVDHLNSTRAIIDDAGNVEQVDYYPFGGFLTGDPVPETTHLFTGHERDTAELASNLDYMHARYFSPNLGRFLSVDPVGGEVGSSQSWNRYTYVLNNPLALVDPFGELWQETLDSTSPYTWVDACGDEATCYESVAAPVGASLVVYGSSGAADMTTLSPNGNGVVDLAPLSSHPDAGFEFKGGAATFLMADAAAAFWNTAAQYQSANPGSQKLLVTDMGAADAANFGPHQTHDLGRSIDLRYQNSMGLNLQDSKAFNAADVDRTRSLVGIASSQGFDQTYTGSISLFGGQGSGRTEYLHMSHIHIGYTRAKALRLFP